LPGPGGTVARLTLMTVALPLSYSSTLEELARIELASTGTSRAGYAGDGLRL
jgi:hypothetical protein